MRASPGGKWALLLAARLRHGPAQRGGRGRYLDKNRLAEASEAA